MAGRMTVIILTLALVGMVSGFPYYYPDRVHPDDECYEHPHGAHGLHQEPVEEESLVIVLKKDDGDIEKYCPGVEYDVEVEYAENILGMVTSSQGEFITEEENPCAMRANLLGPYSSTQTAKWMAPCNSTEATTVKVTCATSPSSAFMWKEVSIDVATKGCADSCS